MLGLKGKLRTPSKLRNCKTTYPQFQRYFLWKKSDKNFNPFLKKKAWKFYMVSMRGKYKDKAFSSTSGKLHIHQNYLYKMDWVASWVNIVSAMTFIKHHEEQFETVEIKVSNNLGIMSNKQLIQPDAMKSLQHCICGLTLHLFCHREGAIIEFGSHFVNQTDCSGWLWANFRATY